MTLGFIFALFVLRFLILQQGWTNPLQFGDAVEGPEVRLGLLREREGALWKYLASFHADPPGSGGGSRAELEELHNRFFYEWTDLRKALERMTEESRETARLPSCRRATHRLHLLSHLEAVLYEIAGDPAGSVPLTGAGDREMAADFRDLLVQFGEQVARPRPEGRRVLEERHAAILEACRAHRERGFVPGADRRWLYRMERMAYLLGEYLQATEEREARRGAGRGARGGGLRSLLRRGEPRPG